ADSLAHDHRDEEALEHYLWCWDESPEHAPAFDAVRLSFLVGSLRRLSTSSPAVLEAMSRRRDAALSTLLDDRAADPPGPGPAAALASLDKGLFAQPMETLQLYDRLVAQFGSGDQRVAALRENLTDRLVDQRRYEEAVQVERSLVDQYQSLIEDLEERASEL